MTKKVKRTISVIIAAVMLLSTMSVLAFADDLPTYTEVTSTEIGPHDHVASVNSDGTVQKTEDRSAYLQPTCVKDGRQEFFVKCKICGKEIPGTREFILIPALSSHHQAGPVTIERVTEPTCGDYGSYWEVTRCVLCNAVLSRNLVAVAPTTNHSPDFPVKENIINATCAQVGSYDSVIYCTVCGKELQRTFKEIPKLTYHVSEYSLDRFVFPDPADSSKVKVMFVKPINTSELDQIMAVTSGGGNAPYGASTSPANPEPTDNDPKASTPAGATPLFTDLGGGVWRYTETATTGTVGPWLGDQNGVPVQIDFTPNWAYPYIDSDDYKTLISADNTNNGIVDYDLLDWNVVAAQTIIIKTNYIPGADVDDVNDRLGFAPTPVGADLDPNNDYRSVVVMVPGINPATGRRAWYGPYYEVSTLLTKSDSGVALGFFRANHYAANRYTTVENDTAANRVIRTGTTRTCADGAEYCAICGELLNPQIPHTWDAGQVTIPATLTTQGKIVYRCLIKGCNAELISATGVRTPQKGDVDGDGNVTSGDARFILRYAVGLGNLDKRISDLNFSIADIDGNKAIEPADARLCLRLAVGLRNP